MDDQGRETSRRQSEEFSKKKKRKRREQRGRALEEAESRLSHCQEIAALSSNADDAATKQNRKEKNSRKLLALQDQDARTGDDRAEDKKNGKEEEYQQLQEGNLCGVIVNDEGKAKKKKVKDMKARLHIEIEEEQEQEHEKNEEGDEKEDQHLKEGNLLRESNKEEKKRKVRKREEEEEKEPLADHVEQVTTRTMNSNSDMDFSQEETNKGKKREKKRNTLRFEDQVSEAVQEQVGNILDQEPSENTKETVEEVWGVRFTSEEDEILKDAVWKYIKAKGWDEQEGLNKVLDSQRHKDACNCWADINRCLPHRPRKAIRYRAHILLEKGAHSGKWSKEEEELLKRLQGEHGRKWKEFSSLLDRHRTSIKEKWRSLKRSRAKGVWTQGELQRLSDLVHKCLRLKASLGTQNKNSTHQILRDDIQWERIADTIGTHSHGSCCGKWYYHLQSSLVADGHWANEDDSLLLRSLLESGACVEEEVEWDSLLDHRSGQLCSTRWKQMVKHLGENRTRVFLDKLDVLACRYAPELLKTSVEDSSNNEWRYQS